MACCGDKRVAAQQALQAGASPKVQQSPSYQAQTRNPVRLQYLQGSHIHVLGPMTHRRYEFSAADPIQDVAPADVGPMIGTGLFRIVASNGKG